MHVMLTFDPALRTKRNDLTSPRKAGALIPIGSEQRKRKSKIRVKIFQPSDRVPLFSILAEERRGRKDSFASFDSKFGPISSSYLYTGVGCPWALQGRLTSVFARRPNRESFGSPAKAGALLPTGSNKQYIDPRIILVRRVQPI